MAKNEKDKQTTAHMTQHRKLKNKQLCKICGWYQSIFNLISRKRNDNAMTKPTNDQKTIIVYEN